MGADSVELTPGALSKLGAPAYLCLREDVLRVLGHSLFGAVEQGRDVEVGATEHDKSCHLALSTRQPPAAGNGRRQLHLLEGENEMAAAGFGERVGTRHQLFACRRTPQQQASRVTLTGQPDAGLLGESGQDRLAAGPRREQLGGARRSRELVPCVVEHHERTLLIGQYAIDQAPARGESAKTATVAHGIHECRRERLQQIAFVLREGPTIGAVQRNAAAPSVVGVQLDVERQVFDYLECLRVFLPVWDKLLVKDDELGSEQELANELVAGVVDSFVRHQSAISDLVVGRADPSTLELGEWRELVQCMLQATPQDSLSEERAHGS